MTNKERLDRLEQANKLIREIEFSYPVDDPIRKAIFKVVVDTFSYLGTLAPIMDGLERAIKDEKVKKCVLLECGHAYDDDCLCYRE